MAYPIEVKIEAENLRKAGFSVKEIARKFGISQGTASLWMRGIKLDKIALERIKNNRIGGQYKANQTKIGKKDVMLKELAVRTHALYTSLALSAQWKKVLCAILFWTEGSKTRTYVSFINSDPMMIEVFMKLMRGSFELDEKKFRGLVHIHDYHVEDEITQFWSKKSGIPLSQFNRSYKKPNTKKRKREGYQGSFRIRYYDTRVAQELYAIYTTLPEFLSGNLVGEK